MDHKLTGQTQQHLSVRISEAELALLRPGKAAKNEELVNDVGPNYVGSIHVGSNYLTSVNSHGLLRVGCVSGDADPSLRNTQGDLELIVGEPAAEHLHADGKCAFVVGGYSVRMETEKYSSNTSEWPAVRAA